VGVTEFLLVMAVGGGIIAVLYATFKGAASEADERPARDPAAAGDEAHIARTELQERHAAAMSSLEEIEADYEAGNLLDADYEELKGRYGREAASVGRRLDELELGVGVGVRAATPTAVPAAGSSRWPAALGWIGGTVGFIAIAWLVMSTALRPRVGNDTITGSLPGQDEARAMGGAAAPLIPVDMERLAELERIVAADSTNVEALVELARLYLSSQAFSEVTQVTLKALSIDPDNPGAHTYLGMVLVSIDHVENGLAAFDRALESDPDFAEALLFKGMISFQRQDFATAVGAWEHYLEVAPASANVDRIKGMLEAARAAAAERSAP
jgi:cytochrome c-type biogenesis protein CcmH/NrfG